MKVVEHLPLSARRLIRGLLPVVVAAGAAVTCDSPTGPARHLVSLAIQPVLRVELAAFGGMAVDQARLIVVRPPSDTVATKTFDFSADSAQITANISVPITDTATFWVTIQLLAGGTVMFSGVDSVLVTSGLPAGSSTPFVVDSSDYKGPGRQIAAIQIAPRDSGISFGGSLQFRLAATDSSANAVSQFYTAWSTPSAASGAGNTINAAGQFRAGRARGTTWVFAHTPTGIRDSTRVTVSPVANQILVVSGNNQTGPVGTALAQPLVVKVLASDNLPVSGVSVQFSASGGGTVNPPAAMTDSLGLAQTIATLGATAGSVAITASIGSVAQTQFTATATQQTGAPANIVKFAGDAQTGATGTAVAVAPAVKVTDASNTPLSGVGVTFAVASGGGSVTGATATTNASGIATVGSWTLGAAAGNNTLTATVASLTPVTFTATAVSPGVSAFVTKTAGDGQTAAAGTALPVRPAVKVTDGLGTRVAGVNVTFAVASGGGSITGGTVATDTGGIATVGSWTLGPATGSNTLTATVTGLTPVTFTATATAALPAITILLPGNAVGQGATVPLPIRLGQPAPAGGVTVTVTSDSTKYLTVASPGTIAFAQGDTVKTINITGVAVGVTILHATATGYTAATLPVVVTPNVIVLGQNVLVAVGQTASLPIQLIPGAPPGGLTVTLASTDSTKVKVTTPTVIFEVGQTTANATVQGVAAGVAGVTATAPNYATGGAAVTAAVAGQAATLTKVAGDAQTAQVGTAVPVLQAVKVTDVFGTRVAGVNVTFAVASGGGSITGATATTDTGGVARVGSWTLGAAAGQNTLMASLGQLTPVVFTATGAASNITSTAVTPHAATLNALGQTVQLVAQAKDANQNNVAGHFTWVSHTPATATVDTTGLVRAVANGTSWVVSTEAGGTKDSAQVTVTQTVASINVTPGTRSIYLTRSFTFTAQAVDGLGHPVPGISSFTWSSTAPAVATVDTAGHVVGVGLGTAQIKATSGTITGVANVSVITPILRIAVVVDTVGAFKTDSFTMTSLGLTRRYRAVAHDTLDAVMTGITFTWVSTNGSVAQLLGFAADTARVVSAANGVTSIQATAQGFTSSPGALLTVAQVLASIELKPDTTNPTATVAVTGTMHVSARGKDANSRYIAGGSFKYRSSTPGIATVDSVTGLVTGVTQGADTVTATSGAITSNPVVVTVSNGGPAIISFGRDTISVGRGSTAPIPILLSKPALSPLTVNLTATAFAHWSAGSVVIPAGQTSANATLVGDSAGTTTVTATDGSGLGYASASAIAKVTANMRLASGGYGINTTDIVTTQVLLSDPSPAGGTYVTFNYSTPGIAAISPDPAFIPAGQLAADIQIRGVAAGSTTITPVATGVNGTSSSFTAYAPVLTPSQSGIRLGVGQYEPNVYVYTPTYTNLPVPVTVTSSDTTVVTVTPSVTIPANSYYAYFTTTAAGIGTATLTVSSPGWTAARTVTVNITTPYVGLCCSNNSLFTTSPQQNVTVYSEDSVRTAHNRASSLLVHLRSTDTTVIKMLDTVVTIPPGLYYNNSGRFVMGALGGTAYIVATASGHQPDSAHYTVAGPPLSFSWGGTPLVGAGQYNSSVYVYTPNNVTQPLVVTLTSSDSTVISVPATVTIPVNSYYAYFTVTGKAPGSVTIGATATGYASVNGSWAVSSPRITACCGATVNNFSAGQTVYAYSTDSLLSAHPMTAPLTVTLFNTDTTKIRLDSTSLTIPAGQYYTIAQAHWTPLDTGTAKIIFSVPGYPALSQDTLTITVVTPQVRLSPSHNSNYPSLLGRRQHFDPNGNGFYVYTPDYRSSPLVTTIVQKHGTVDSLTTTAPTIPLNSYYAYLDAYGLANGTDTLIVSAAGYRPDTAFIAVTTPKFTTSGLPGSTTTTNPPIGITVYATDSVGSGHYTMDTVVVAAVSSDSTVIKPVLPFVRIPRNQYYVNTSVNIVGPGTASMTYSDSAGSGYASTTTNVITVTGPSLALSNGAPVLGMRQHGGGSAYYVYVPNNVASPLVVHLLSTGTRVATVPDSVIIPASSYYHYFDVTAQDTVGTIQIQATATGYGGANMNVQVTQPKLVMNNTSTQANTTSPPQTVYVYTTDANGTAHYTNEDVVVTLASSAPAVATIDSGTVTIPSGTYYVNTPRWSPGIAGTAQLSATDTRAVYYKYNTGTVNVTVLTPSLNIYSTPGTLGLGQYADYVYVQAPDNQASDLAVTFTHTGATRAGTFTNLTNTPITGLTIAQNTYYKYFRMAGLARGTDTLTASATSPAHNPSTIYTVVDSGRVDPIGSWPGSIKAGDSVLVTLYARDPNTTVRYVVAATDFTLAPNSNIEFHLANAVVTQVTIPADAQYVQFYLVGKSAGTGSVSITSATYKTYSNTVTVTP